MIMMDTGVESLAQVDKELSKGSNPELGREGDDHMERESMLHQVNPYTDMLLFFGESDSESVQNPICSKLRCTDPDLDKERDVDQLSNVVIHQQINTIAVNLKVSQELLQQAIWSLEIVEKHPELDHRQEDQLESGTRFTDTSAVSCSASSMSLFMMPHTNLSGVSAPSGPQSKQYSLLLHSKGCWVKNLEEQLLSRDWKLLSEEELGLWLSHYPPEQLQYEQNCLLQHSFKFSVGTGHSTEKQSQYRSALENGLHGVQSDIKLQVRGFTW